MSEFFVVSRPKSGWLNFFYPIKVFRGENRVEGGVFMICICLLRKGHEDSDLFWFPRTLEIFDQ